MLVISPFAVAGRWVREVRDDTANQFRSGVRGHVPSGSRAMTVAARSTLRSSDARGTWHEARGTWHGARGTERTIRRENGERETDGKRKRKGQLKVTFLPGFALRASPYRQKGHKRGSTLVALMPLCRCTSEINVAFVLP